MLLQDMRSMSNSPFEFTFEQALQLAELCGRWPLAIRVVGGYISPQASAGIEELKLTKDWRAHSVLAKQPNLLPETLIRKIAESKGSALLRYLEQEQVSLRQ